MTSLENSKLAENVIQEIVSSGNVHINNIENVKKILSHFFCDGWSHFQVVADFDATLSAYSLEGKRCESCHNSIEQSRFTSKEAFDEAEPTHQKYYSIEISSDLSIQEKYPFMEEWYKFSHDSILKLGLSKNNLEEIVRDSNMHLRKECPAVLKKFSDEGIPVLIFSAGIGNILEIAIQQQADLTPNIKVVSNYLKFDEQGNHIGFEDEIIHTFNKNESLIHKSGYFESIAHRHNVMLLGDTLGDLGMSKGCKGAKNILKIGFLNVKISENLELYKNSFDIVIVDQESIQLVQTILSGLGMK